MNHLEEAKENMDAVIVIPTEAHDTIQNRLRQDAKAHALIAIAENGVAMLNGFDEITNNLNKIAEQLEKIASKKFSGEAYPDGLGGYWVAEKEVK